MYGLFGGAAGRAAGRMATALDGGKGGYSQDPKIRQRAGLMDPMREDEEERRRRGLFGRIGDMFSQDALSQTNAAGVTRGEQLGAMLMSLAGPQQQAQAMNMLGNARARGDEERRLAEAQREEREQAKLEGVQANEERARQIQQIYALEEQFGLERGSLALLPEEARDGVIAELSARRFTPDAPEAPVTRTVQIGGETVTQQWNPQTQQFEEIGRAPRWNPNPSPAVQVNTGDSGQELSPFQLAMSEAEGEVFAGFMERAPQANRNLIRIDQLEGLLSESGSGLGAVAQLVAGDFGVQLGEGVGELQAARALINSMVPEQRQPGSGPMSDADLELFKQSLPRLINTPEGNRIIIETMRAINQYDATLGHIAQMAASGGITQAEARRQVNMLNNPIDDVRDALSGSTSNPSNGPAVGEVIDGHEFLGGDPADRNNWQRR